MSDQATPAATPTPEVPNASQEERDNRAAKLTEMRKEQQKEPDTEKVMAAVNACNEAVKELTTAEKARVFNAFRMIHFNA